MKVVTLTGGVSKETEQDVHSEIRAMQQHSLTGSAVPYPDKEFVAVDGSTFRLYDIVSVS